MQRSQERDACAPGTRHPFLDRDALINAIDYEVTPNGWWRISGQVMRSDIGHAGTGVSPFRTP